MIKQADGSYELNFIGTSWQRYFLEYSRDEAPAFRNVKKLSIKNFKKALDIDLTQGFFEAQLKKLLNKYLFEDFHLEIWPDNIDPDILGIIIKYFETWRADFIKKYPTFQTPAGRHVPTMLLQYDALVSSTDDVFNSAINTPPRASTPQGAPFDDSGFSACGEYISPPRPEPRSRLEIAFDGSFPSPPRPGRVMGFTAPVSPLIQEIEKLELSPVGKKIRLRVLYYDGIIGTYACKFKERLFYFTLSTLKPDIIFFSKKVFFKTTVCGSPEEQVIGHEIVEWVGNINIKTTNFAFKMNEFLEFMIRRGYGQQYKLDDESDDEVEYV